MKTKLLLIAAVAVMIPMQAQAAVSVDTTTDATYVKNQGYSAQTADMINNAKAKGKKLVAVGTTSVRTLETAYQQFGEIKACKSASQLFIYPPYEFKVVDNMLTNFHLPKSTLLMLISALAGKDFVFEAYKSAIEEKYRFYSYGDCMYIC